MNKSLKLNELVKEIDSLEFILDQKIGQLLDLLIEQLEITKDIDKAQLLYVVDYISDFDLSEQNRAKVKKAREL